MSNPQSSCADGVARSWWPIGIVIFFSVVAVFQGVVLYIGFSHKNTLIEDQPYERGLVYQQAIDAASRVKERGLTLELQTEAAGPDGRRKGVITIRSPHQFPDFNERAVLHFKRPASGRSDVQAVFVRDERSGRFAGSAVLREPGLWLLEVRLYDGTKEFLFKEQVMLP